MVLFTSHIVCSVYMCIFLCIFKCFIHLKSRFRLKNPILPIEKILSLVPPRKTIMLQHLIIQFSFNYLSSGLLRESKYKRHFQTFSGRSRLRELFLYNRFQRYRFDLETFGILENWSLRRSARLQEVVSSRGCIVIE